jgi:hypothetical protein
LLQPKSFSSSTAYDPKARPIVSVISAFYAAGGDDPPAIKDPVSGLRPGKRFIHNDRGRGSGQTLREL